MSQQESIRIDYDDQPDDILRKINAALTKHGITLEDDDQPHGGYVVWIVKKECNQ